MLPEITPEDIYSIAEIVMRISLAALFGGMVGYEREATNRPAGFRTHVLVCVGAALAMMTGEHAARLFPGSEPTRVGAQVVSGIGFLGAGTIMRAGFNVRGLTTAASLWAVSCVGLACGIGFYSGAIAVGVSIFIIMTIFKRVERGMWEKNTFKTAVIRSRKVRRSLTELNALFGSLGVEVKHLEFQDSPREGESIMRFTIRMPNCSIPELNAMIEGVPDVIGASIE